ncbi:hypothetical protein, partial [Hyphomicrobium sp.]|uniref:hypothetical protein n=1 Tax=Hyphomicrobium sp. TaxID=82 RepID=UPI0025B8C174
GARPVPQPAPGGYGTGRPLPQQPARPTAGLRKDAGLQGTSARAADPLPQDGAGEERDVPGSALKSLRDRLIQRQQR